MKTDIDTLLSEEQLVQQALDALLVALGPVETARFLALKQQGQLDSVAQHRAWQASLGGRNSSIDLYVSYTHQNIISPYIRNQLY